MSGWMWVIFGVACAAAVSALGAGGLLVAFAVAGRGSRGAAVRAVTLACSRCGYDLDGLDAGCCPECGMASEPGRLAPVRRRVGAALAGLAMIGLGVAGGLGAHIARTGWSAAAPSAVLIAMLPLAPVSTTGESDLHRALHGRIDSGRLAGWERAWLGGLCISTLSAGHTEGERLAAAKLMGGLAEGGWGCVESTLRAMNDDPSPAVRRRLVETLGRLAASQPDPDLERLAVQGLMGAALGDPDAAVRRSAVEALGRLPEDAPGAAGVFARALRDPSPAVRARTLYTLYGRPRGPGAPGVGELAAIALAAQDQHQDVREAAVFALSRLAERFDGAVLMLSLSLRDGSPAVRESAAACLGRLGPRAAAAWPWLAASAADDDPGVQSAVISALESIAGGRRAS